MHSHTHGHHHHPHSHPKNKSDSKNQSVVTNRMAWAFWLNLGFSILELVGGIWTGSLAILSDALHDFGDALSLGFAYFLEKKSHESGSDEFSYGLRRYSVFSAVITGGVLIAGAAVILAEAVPRIFEPTRPDVTGMIGFAILGLIVNGVSFLKFAHGTSLAETTMRWHFVEDLAGWAIVLVGAVLMKFADLPQLDPILAACLSVWVVWNVFRNLKRALRVLLQATPDGTSMDEIRHDLLALPAVRGVHHIHIWSVDGDAHILTAHLVLPLAMSLHEEADLKIQIKKHLHAKFNIQEATLETEREGDPCLDPVH